MTEIATTPKALLLDFGGVVVETARRPSWQSELAAEVHRMLAATGRADLTAEDIELDIRAGRAAHGGWKDAMSRPYTPREATHREFWSDYVAADWPESDRVLVEVHAQHLCRRMVELQAERKPRHGIHELLAFARDRGILVGIVSNALVGEVHREVVRELGLDDFIQVQVYSDEVGIRKPNPRIIGLASSALSVVPGDSWYVGDNYDRDVVCGRRAGAGATVLMIAEDTYDPPYRVRDTPDLTVEDPAALLAVLRRTGS
ncbi:HAD family hydrolase [Phytoactinopolyspora mesophila]|uniref:HAD-IA family hydrolase n=1 Tax=Phytoactinopolyspora mesophila TaxID=2650750 RepID=A0A7K3M5W0_9ACTN|nr:HAD-IA family hydrolase [Phytoactinopolyspora mesophila]NDL58711.1 HAD-IA family hydrolase [Phytoactinopolyspora mesophila]